ncbi:MAG: iron ABC transporter permease [Rhizobiales bacterium]|nr:iron ABC transporter permease [Hyphomicrobiales bacterium]
MTEFAITNRRDPHLWWRVGAICVSALLLLPIAAIAYLALTPSENIWPHLVATVLPDYLAQTAMLMFGVGALTFVIGTSSAWMITMYGFPGRKVLQWMLLVPLAMPTYIIAYTYVDMFEYAGPFQSALREAAGWTAKSQYWFPDIRSTGGAIFVMSLVLYPYVFITARASFMRQSVGHLEVARTLGRSPAGVFFTVALPLARPAIAVGVSLAMMECLNDIGAVEHFGVRTLTLGIYSTWLGRGNLGGAAQIALVMFIFVIALLWLERFGRKKQSYFSTSSHDYPVRRTRLRGWRRWAASLLCFLPVGFGFALPGGLLLSFALARFGDAATPAFADAVINTLVLASFAAAIAVLIGLFLAYANRIAGNLAVRMAVRMASVGYAIPGTVLGIGILVPLAATDNAVSRFAENTFGFSTGLILSGSIAAITFGYVVRFLAISHGNLETGLQRVTPSLAAAARTLGRTPVGALRDVHLPLIRPALVSAALLVFVDCMKELPATLILRPFNFETLSTMVYTLASLDQLEDSALAALTIVASGIIPVIILSRTMRGKKPRRASGR